MLLQSTGLATGYLFSNILLNFLNKLALGPCGFHFPVLLSMIHMTVSSIVLWAMRGHSLQSTLPEAGQRKCLFAIGILMASSIALNNASLVSMTLALNQIIR